MLQALFNTPIDTAKAIGRYRYYRYRQNDLQLQDDNCTLTGAHLRDFLDLGCVPASQKTEIHDRRRDLLYALTMPLRPIENGMIDPVGKRAWLAMVARAKFAAQQPCATPRFGGETLKEDRDDFGTCERGGLAELFEMLQALAADVEDGLPADAPARMVVTVIAHSAGTILANEIIERYPCAPYKDVVFMGAALTIRDAVNGTLAVLDDKARGLLCNIGEPNPATDRVSRQSPRPFGFYNLSLHPKAEARSKGAYGVIPAGSLLAWIDDIFVDPADPLERTLGQWTNVMTAMNCRDQRPEGDTTKNCDPLFFNGHRLKALYRPRVLLHFKRFGLGVDDPRYHGDFSNGADPDSGVHFAYWDPECWRPGGDSCAMPRSTTNNQPAIAAPTLVHELGAPSKTSQ